MPHPQPEYCRDARSHATQLRLGGFKAFSAKAPARFLVTGGLLSEIHHPSPGGSLDAGNGFDAGLVHGAPGGGERTVEIDGATGRHDDGGGKTLAARINRREVHAKVGSEPDEEDAF